MDDFISILRFREKVEIENKKKWKNRRGFKWGRVGGVNKKEKEG